MEEAPIFFFNGSYVTHNRDVMRYCWHGYSGYIITAYYLRIMIINLKVRCSYLQLDHSVCWISFKALILLVVISSVYHTVCVCGGGCICVVHISCILFVTQSTGWEVGGSIVPAWPCSCFSFCTFIYSHLFICQLWAFCCSLCFVPYIQSINICRQCQLSGSLEKLAVQSATSSPVYSLLFFLRGGYVISFSST